MSRDPCLACGAPAEDLHHPTGRVGGEGTPYLDADLRAPVCHDDHELLGDDLRLLAESEPDLTTPTATLLERLEVRLRRLAAMGGRIAGAIQIVAIASFVASLAGHVQGWANDLRRVIDALDLAFPAWRTLPAVQA